MSIDAGRPRESRYSIEDRIGVLEELLGERFSCRAFKSEAVPRAVIERVLKAAQRTASWCNSQPWQVVIASGEAKEKFRKEIYAAASSGGPDDGDFPFPREYRGVYLERRRGKRLPALQHARHCPRRPCRLCRQALENFNFFGAPHIAIIHTDEALGVYGAIDCGAYVGNFMLAAQALGLGTIPQAALAHQSGLIRRHFGISDDRRVVCGISFGYADRDHRINGYRTSRAGVVAAVTFIE